ncbi:MAG TPA: hypothetical protein VMK12_26440 [Anaeromyxobacteraceae bacterium]|nr:hypothetical protein [Anaeromyxobacteraceae bacterium]
MVQQRQLAGPRRMERLRVRIEMWRSSREKLQPMPARLWREAAALARELGAGPVGRALGLNHQALKKHMEVRGNGWGGADVAEAPTAGFVELARTQVLGMVAATGPIVEVSDARGVKLTVRLAAGSSLNLAELVEIFRGRSV